MQTTKMELLLFTALSVFAANMCVHGLPTDKRNNRFTDFKKTSIQDTIPNGGVPSNTSASDMSTVSHSFIKFDNLRNRKLLQNKANLKLRGFSSMRMLSPEEIVHPDFDPNNFLKVAGSENTQQIEVLPVIEEPYFMFVPQKLLQNGTLKDGIFSKIKRRRVKRHHPGVLQNVLGELQNFALVPIKSANGQIRYILLKNPKFVIGNPKENGQMAPTIVQLNSNRGISSTSGQIRYTPRAPMQPAVTKPPYRTTTLRFRLPPSIPRATSIDSIFSRGKPGTVEESTSTETKNSSKTSKSSLERMTSNRRVSFSPFSIPGLTSKSSPFTSDSRLNSDAPIPTSAAEMGQKVLAGLNLRNIPNVNLVKSNTASSSTMPRKPGLDKPNSFNLSPTLNITAGTQKNTITKTQSASANSMSSFNQDPTTEKEINKVLEKVKSLGTEQLVGTGDIQGTHLKVRNTSVEGETITSKVNKRTQTDNSIKSSSAESALTNIDKNSTYLDHKNVSNIKLVKDGKNHKIVHTEVVETKVDLENNHTEAKIDKAQSDVVKVVDGPGGHAHIEAASVKTADTDKAKAEKQANILKKTKKTTTITVKSPLETKSGRPEISEIQHTVEELLHHNTSETAATELASSANVNVSSSEGGAGSHTHGQLKPVNQAQENNSASSKQVDSTSTMKKAVKKTTITKTPDSGGPGESQNNSLDQPTGLLKVEEIIQETSHTSKQTRTNSSSSDTAHV